MQNAKEEIQGAGELGSGEPMALGHVDNVKQEAIVADNSSRDIPSKTNNNKIQKRNVLLVEDCPLTQRVHRAFLDESKYNIDVAEDGVAALEKFRRNHYDLVILDMDLPKLSGISVCRKIRKRLFNRTTPIVMVSARKDIEILCLQHGANAFLPKPVEAKILIETVKHLLS